MRPRVITFTILAVVLAAGCIRLGFWQLSRLEWRRALNAEVASHFSAPPVPVEQLPSDTGALHFRRVTLRGVFDYANEVVITQRMRGGSPGVNLLTPLRRAGTDTAYLVNRGWVYSPNGKDIEAARWREADTVDVLAFAVPIPPLATPAAGAESGRLMRTLDVAEVRKALPYAVAPVQLVQLGDTAPKGNVPPRLLPPPPSEGAHKSYAVQWFSFATIALVGAVIFAVNDRNRHRPRVDDT